MESILIWIVGLLTGMGIIKLYQGLKSKRLITKWYHWLVGVIWYLIGIFIILFVSTSFYENEPQAAGMAILIFGGVFIVISILLYRFVFTKTKSKEVEV